MNLNIVSFRLSKAQVALLGLDVFANFNCICQETGVYEDSQTGLQAGPLKAKGTLINFVRKNVPWAPAPP